MRSVRVDCSVPSTKRLAELNHQRTNGELKEVVKGKKTAFNGQQGISEEERLKTNEDANGGRQLELLQAQCGPLRQNQQPQGSVVQWDRFLPVRTLKVLLVENDDSTRSIVSALLRNCSYEVTAVADGLEAWKILADPTKHIDLVLTEVVMPHLSGVGLLSKIMSNISCKSIPVIMMSSDDSMGIVFNCLSKGAVDFLVKPIRKNELKNLWQHVWRKCHSSSGSGSESGIGTQKSPKSRSIEGSDNEPGSDDEEDSGSISLTAKDGSDIGSETQSSWSKRAVEVNSSKVISPWHQADPPNSTCAQVAHTRPEAFSSYRAPTPASRECVVEDDKLDTLAMGKDLAIGVSRDNDLQLVGPSKKGTSSVARMSKEKLPESNSNRVTSELQKGKLELICETAGGELRTETADLVGTITKTTNAQLESAAVVPNELSKIANTKERDSYSKELPVLELSLKRARDAEDTETRAQQRNVLRQSNFSAFSRYHTASNSNPAPNGNVGSCSPLDNSSEALKGESTQYLNSTSNENPNQQSNGSSNNDDMGSTTNNAFTEPEKLPDNNQIPKSIVSINPSSAMVGAHEDHTSSLQPVIPSTADGEAVGTLTAANQPVQVRHHHHHYHHHHHHVHNTQQQKQISKHDDPSLRNMASNVFTGSTEGNAANYGSASGSNNRSNGENGSSGKQGSPSAAVAEVAKRGSDTGVTAKGKCGTGDVTGSGSGSGSGVDQSRLTLREAALNKFRQKRKERCFEKKVRYQSRKKLAEQRPRVRGQFVRQGVQENKNEANS